MKIRAIFTILTINYLFKNSSGQLRRARSEKTYMIDGQERVTWAEALDRCQRRGMELVSIESAEENAHLVKLLGPAESSQGVIKDFWTSGRLTDGRQWVWASGNRPFRFTDWAPGAPNDYLGHEQCLRLWGLHRFQWDDFFCKAKMHFICQRTSPAEVETQGQDPDYVVKAKKEFEKMRDGVGFAGVEQPEFADAENPDFEYAKIVTIAGLDDGQQLPLEPRMQVRPGGDREVPKRPQRPHAQVYEFILYMNNSSFVFMEESLGWEEAKRKCNYRGLELAVFDIDGIQAKEVQEYLKDHNWQDKYDYWVGYLHVRNGHDRTKSKREARDKMQPSIQLTIGLQPGIGNVVGGLHGYCPLMVFSDGARLTHQWCQVKNRFVCQGIGAFFVKWYDLENKQLAAY